jgi:hypothetical protein
LRSGRDVRIIRGKNETVYNRVVGRFSRPWLANACSGFGRIFDWSPVRLIDADEVVPVPDFDPPPAELQLDDALRRFFGDALNDAYGVLTLEQRQTLEEARRTTYRPLAR